MSRCAPGDVPAMARARLDRLLAYWDGLRDGAAMPLAHRFDILGVRDLAGLLHLLEVLEESGRTRFRFRVYGTAVARYNTRDLTGRYVDEITPPEWQAAFAADLEDIRRTRQPCWSRSDAQYDFGWVAFWRLGCPLADADGRIARILFAVMPLERDGSAARAPG
jgi:hypothetical protein